MLQETSPDKLISPASVSGKMYRSKKRKKTLAFNLIVSVTNAAAVIIVGHPVQQDSVSPVFVYDGIEELSIPPAAGEVVAAQTLVSLHHPLGPEQQLLLGRHVVGLAVHLNV